MKGLESDFIKWVHSVQPNALEFNPGSVQQLQQLLFAPCSRNVSSDKIKKTNMRTTVKVEKVQEMNDEYDYNNEGSYDKGNSGNGKNFIEVLPEERIFRVENFYVNFFF